MVDPRERGARLANDESNDTDSMLAIVDEIVAGRAPQEKIRALRRYIETEINDPYARMLRESVGALSAVATKLALVDQALRDKASTEASAVRALQTLADADKLREQNRQTELSSSDQLAQRRWGVLGDVMRQPGVSMLIGGGALWILQRLGVAADVALTAFSAH